MSSKKEATVENARRIHRYYIRNSRLTFGEDRMREFKGHRNLAREEVPRSCIRSRSPVSRNINGFLNSGQGGRIYLGVLDNGVVLGLALTEAQKDHVRISLEDLMGRYTPRVPPSRYQLAFVPVIGCGEKGRERDSGVASEEEGAVAGFSHEERMRGHLLRTARYCWCDTDARMLVQKVSVPYYVVEISILPFIRDPTLPPMVLQLYPIYQNEQGQVYIRGSTSLQEYSYRQVAELTINEVEAHFSTIKKRLREEVKECMLRVTSVLADIALRQSPDCHVTNNTSQTMSQV